MSQLPPNWLRAPIGGLCDLKNGRAFKPAEWSQDGLPIVRIQNLNNAFAPFNRFNGEYDQKHHLRGGELLFAWSGTPGTSFGAHVWRGGPALLNQHIFRVDFDDALLDRRFFRHAINQKLTELIGVAHGGAGLQHVTKGVFEGTEVALPPRAEQKRIADKLDTVLTRVDAVNTRLARVAPILKRFRQSVLAAATSGRLTEDWRVGQISDWDQPLFADVVDESSTGLVRSASEQAEMQEGLVPYLKMNSVGEMWGYECVDLPGVHCSSEELRRYELRQGDWLFNTRNSVELVGKSCVWNGPAGVVFNNNLLRVRFKAGINPAWVEIFFRSPQGRDLLAPVKSATTSVAAIYQRSLMGLPILLPSVEEQTEIIHRVETLFAFADRLEARLQTAQTAANRLTPALLAKAFRGELVPQDPNDEPAIELLRRLQQGTPKTGTKRGRKSAV